ncbi:MAG: Adenylate/guanylate cyclase protein [Thermoleophilia bacterium]|nr:Adenylate/guanylate cyclase protein [Thermoleophilia bacterium]
MDELLGVAMSAAGQGDWARAVRLAAAAYAEKEVLEMESDRWWSGLQERYIGGARAQLAPEELEAAERAGRAASFDAVLDEVLGTETVPAAP